MKATLTNYRQSPRKVRLVATLIKGKKVNDALVELSFLNKRASDPIKKLIASAAANAVANFKQDKEDLVVKNLTVDKGIVLKRFLPGARGRAYRLNRRGSNITVTLDIKTAEEKKTKKVKKEETKPVAKVAKPAKKVAKKAVKADKK